MSHNRKDLIKVNLQVKHSLSEYPGRSRNYFVAVVGPGIQLGNENPAIAPRCRLVGNNIWEKDLWLPRNNKIYYKFLVVSSFTGAVKDMETIAPRQLYTGQSPFTVEHFYNKINGRKIGDTRHNIPIRRRENWGYKNTKPTQNITEFVPKCAAPHESTENSIPQTKDDLVQETKANLSSHQESTDKTTTDKQLENKQDQTTNQETNYTVAEPTNIIKESSNDDHIDDFTETNGVSETKGSKCGLFNRKNMVLAMTGLAVAGLGLAAFFRK